MFIRDENSVEREIRKRIVVFSYSLGHVPPSEIRLRMYVSCDSSPPFSGINQRRKTCRKVLTSHRGEGRQEGGGGPFASKRGLSRRPYRVVPGGIFSFSLPDPAWRERSTGSLPSYRVTCGHGEEGGRAKSRGGKGGRGEEEREAGTGYTVGPYRRSRMTRQANCVISVQRMLPRFPPPLPLPKLPPLYTARVFVSRICRSRRWQLQRARANLSRIAF